MMWLVAAGGKNTAMAYDNHPKPRPGGQRESGYLSQGSPVAEGKALASLVTSGRMTAQQACELVTVPVATERVLRQFAMQGDRDDQRLVANSLQFRAKVLAELRRQLGGRTDGEGNGT
jgi:hypothetical protein